MDKIFVEKLERLNQDELLVKAIMEVFVKRIEKERPRINEINENSVLGEKFRAYEEAQKIIKNGFKDLVSYGVSRKKTAKFNKAI